MPRRISRISNHLRSNVVGYAALFVALSGTAWAANGPLAGKNTVGSSDIINGEVRAKDVADAPSGSDALNADTLDGLDSEDFAPGEVHVADREKVNDPTPGDLSPASTPLLTSGPVTITGDCTDDISLANEDRGEIRFNVTGLGNASLSMVTSDPFETNIPTFGGSVTAMGVSTPNAGNANVIRSGYFTVVAPAGDVVSGAVSVELNDSDGGSPSDCTFAATAVG